MNISRLMARIQRHEGYSESPYLDHLGNWTIGWGHNVHRHDMRALMPHRTLGSMLDWLCSRATHERWLSADVNQAESDARRFVTDRVFDRLSDARQEVLVEMAFQMGGRRLNSFSRFRGAVQLEQWVRAEAEMRDSLWAKVQTPGRANELAELFLAG